MIAMSVKSELGKLQKKLNNIQKKQIPFATAKALTATAKHVQAEQATQVEKDFDKPTPFTKKGFYIKAATKGRLYSVVGIKDIQAKYLQLQITGGIRRPKRKALIAPVQQRRNRYGNIPKGRLKTLAAKPNTFSGVINGTAGMWERTKSGRLKLLVSYSDKQEYKKRYDFVGASRKMAQKRFPIEISRAISQALRSAR